MVLEYVACDLCGSNALHPFRQIQQWRIVRCSTCQLLFVNPRPDKSGRETLYSEEYFKTGEIQHQRESETVEREIAARIDTVERITRLVGMPGRWLDVGCASGFLIAAAAKRGWHTTGVEVGTWAAEFGRNQLGLDIFHGSTEEFMAQREQQPQFDVITAMSVLEHLPAPSATASLIRSALKPGGWFIARVPNISSVDSKWHGDQWRGWQLPHHLYHFSPRTISHLLASAGFRVQRVEYEAWNPIRHLSDARSGAGFRTDFAPSARTRMANRSSSSSGGPAQLAWKVLRSLTTRVLTGRDLIIYATNAD